ncbi:MAG: GlcNAc-PI de-N-acetylase [Proteobacteria bacterium]|nr:GlcNAc-PI de-N-acetylase [Pseudomonadota bacterium]
MINDTGRSIEKAATGRTSEPLVLMVVHAHPDDEAIGSGGILRKYSNQGIRTVLVVATKGEAGEIDGRIPTDEERERIVDLRLEELECSRRILGVQHVHFMGYRDSGMAGTPENKFPGAFAAADLEEAVGRLVQIIRRERPHVITTYNEKGTYGHPDHIMVNRVTVRAFEDAGRSDRYPDQDVSPWQPRKLYVQEIPLSRIRKLGEIMRSRAKQLDIDPESMGVVDDGITTWIDIRDVLSEKFAAIRCHKSQVGENSFFNQFSKGQRVELFGFECFRWAAGQSKPKGRETDLFDGLRAHQVPQQTLGQGFSKGLGNP